MRWILIDSWVMRRRVRPGEPFRLLPWERVVGFEDEETQEELKAQGARRCSLCKRWGVFTFT